jgi:hypothetical protein
VSVTCARESAAVDRVIDRARQRVPRAAADAEHALQAALAGIQASAWPEVAWRFSRLTGDGFPVEFTFSSADAAVRYTTEIGAPEMSDAARTSAALRWAGLEEPIAAADRGVAPALSSPRWGAWVGGCHTGAVSRRKAYLEASIVDANVTSSLPRGAVLRFLGVTADPRDREYYFRRDSLETAEVGRLLCGADLRECFDPLREAVCATLPRPVRDRLVPAEAGFSLVTGRAVTLFTYARSVWGTDASIRQAVLDLAGRHAWDLSLYEEVTRPLADRPGYLTHHGVLAWIAAPGQPVAMRVSVRPPGD